MKRILAISLFAMLLFAFGCSRSDMVRISNGKLTLGFERETGKLVSFLVTESSREMIDAQAVDSLPWALLISDKKQSLEGRP